jgi:hypothetical protein
MSRNKKIPESYLIHGSAINEDGSSDENTREVTLIEARLQGVLEAFGEYTPLNPQLVAWLADWTNYRQLLNKTAGCSSNDWDVRFLRLMLKGNVKDFVHYCKKYPTDQSKLALSGIMAVYDYQWPHSSVTGYIFGYMWGWLQLELEKPGESKPMTEKEQRDGLTKSAAENGQIIYRFTYDGFGGVQAIMKENENE